MSVFSVTEIRYTIFGVSFNLTEARIAVVPVQDLLGLPSRHRMNRPGTPEGSWSWRLREGKLTDALAEKIAALTKKYGR